MTKRSSRAEPTDSGNLSPAFESLVDIIDVDRDLVAAAGEGEPQTESRVPTDDIDRWPARLSTTEHVALLSRVARGDASVAAELMRRCRRHTTRRALGLPLRTAGNLRAPAKMIALKRHQAFQDPKARKPAPRER
jgi:hypothetical protein